MTFLDAYAPWGSPVVPGIPLPPFVDEAEHRRYTRMLQLHLALIDGAGPSLPSIALSTALDRTRLIADADGTRWLTPLELSASLTTWFPAPWTPQTLAQTLARAHNDSPSLHGRRWVWFSDPDFRADPLAGGGWTITRHERGDRVSEPVSDDRDLVVLWLAHFREKFGFPLGHGHDAAEVAAIAPSSLAVLAADEVDAAFPYRGNWRAERDSALAAARPDVDRPAAERP